MKGERAAAVSILVEGNPDARRFESLTQQIGECEMLPLGEGLTGDTKALRRAVDDAASHWILLLRDGERVGNVLSAEVSRETGNAAPRAWGFRIATNIVYCGEALRLRRAGAGEVRLFHRRKTRLLDGGRANVQGSVVRLEATIDRVLHDSEKTHVEALVSAGGVRVGALRRLTRWIASILRNGPAALSGPTRRYLWVEAGYRRP